MGTRHLVCVVKNNEYKVAQYGQWDGYPDGQGLNVLNFLNDEMDRDTFDNKVAALSFISQEELSDLWTEAGANPDSPFVSMEVSDRFKQLHPENSRDTGAEVLSLIQNAKVPLKLKNSIDFVSDSLFCEWTYVVDLDKNTFEVYEGFNQEPLSESERFYSFPKSNEYYPVKHVVTFDLNNLPNQEEFLKACKTNDEDEDEYEEE